MLVLNFDLFCRCAWFFMRMVQFLWRFGFTVPHFPLFFSTIHVNPPHPKPPFLWVCFRKSYIRHHVSVHLVHFLCFCHFSGAVNASHFFFLIIWHDYIKPPHSLFIHLCHFFHMKLCFVGFLVIIIVLIHSFKSSISINQLCISLSLISFLSSYDSIRSLAIIQIIYSVMHNMCSLSLSLSRVRDTEFLQSHHNICILVVHNCKLKMEIISFLK